MEDMDSRLLNAFDLIESMMTNVSKEDLERDDFLSDIAVKLIKLRLNLKKTQAEVAEQCHITQAMVSKMESGFYNPSIAKLWEYVKHLGGAIKLDIRVGENAEYSIRLEKDLQNKVQTAQEDVSEKRNPMRMKYNNSSVENWAVPQEAA